MWRSSPPGCAKPRRSARRWLLEREADRVLSDRDEVAVGELFLDHRLAVDQRAVGAAKIADPERAGPNLDTAMPARGRGVADDDVVVGCAANRNHLIRQRHDPARERAALEAQLR